MSAVEQAPGVMAPDWVFELNDDMGGAAGEAFTNALASTGMPTAAVLAREAVQNSVDARKVGKVRVCFRASDLSGQAKVDFIEASGLIAIGERAEALHLAEPNCFGNLDQDDIRLRLIYVEDYNTTGLEGDYTKRKSKFYRFLLSLGDGEKVDQHGTCGSFGFGKSVYSSNSAVRSIFAYSRTVDETGKPISLTFGCGYFRSHEFENADYTGRAWFGIDQTPSGPGARHKVRPLTGADADALAKLLGFKVRGGERVRDIGVDRRFLRRPDRYPRGCGGLRWPRIISIS